MLALIVFTSLLAIQSTECRAPNVAGGVIAQNVRAAATATSGALARHREALQLPLVTSRADVVLIRDEQICTAAAAAYDAELQRLGGSAPAPRSVFVLQIGDRYVVYDTDVKVGEWISVIQFTAQWTFISAWGG